MLPIFIDEKDYQSNLQYSLYYEKDKEFILVAEIKDCKIEVTEANKDLFYSLI